MQRRASVAVDKESGCPIRIRHLDDVIENDMAEFYRKQKEKPLRYEDLDKEDFTLVDKLLRGGINLNELPCQQSKVVRVFVCSSGADFDAERNYVFENVYPHVRQYCRNNYGVDFQMVDMYWGDADTKPNCPDKMAAIHEELRHCQSVSMGPNFVAFIGQKYGSPRLPLEIPSDEMDAMLSALEEAGKVTTLLETWYQKDTNVTPNVYRLQQNVQSSADETDDGVMELLQSGAAIEKTKVSKYTCSDFNRLVQAGLLDVEKDKRHQNCIVYTREIKNIDQHLGAKNAATFVDVVTETCTWDADKKKKIEELRTQIENSLPESNILNSDIELNGCTLDEEKAGNYMTNIGRHFFSTITRIVDTQMEKRSRLCSDVLIHEASRHWARVPDTAYPFCGREDVLNAIKGYLLTDTDQPLVLFGESGCGKSTIIAKAANDINEAITNADLSMPTAVIPRFVAETGQTEDVQPFLLNLSHQLAYICGRYRQDIPTEFNALKNYFIDLIQRGEYGGMIVILLDSLDLLSTFDNGHKLDWLPSRIASNVKIIVTMNSEHQSMLQRLGNKIDIGLIHLPYFTAPDCENTMKVLMGACKRSVNYNQWKRVQMAFNACASPLFAKICYEEVLKWQSFDDVSENVLEHSLEDSIRKIFERLEQQHGKLVVSAVLGYLTASKDGLSESELEDILSLDEDLLNSIFVRNNKYTNIRRFPACLWSRIRQDICPYLVQREIDGIAVLNWKYNRFAQVAVSRYCDEEDDNTVKLYSNISDYFLGTWSGTRKKTFTHPSAMMAKYKLMKRDDETCRHLPEQPLAFGAHQLYNTRKMSQLPYSLALCKRHDDLKSAVFCNYEWLDFKLKVFSIERVLNDFNLIEDREISLVRDALKMSKSALSINPKALGMEITGRLLPHVSKYPYIKELIRQCDLHAQSTCPLVPNCQIYSAPGGPLQYECDVSGGINCSLDIDVFTSPDGILLTAKPTYSNRLQVWELLHGEERPDIMLPVGMVKPTKNGKYMNIFVGNKSIKTYRSDCGVLHGEVAFGPANVSDIDVSNKYIAFAIHKGTGPYVVDIERSEVLHKFTYHTHAVAISDEETYVAFNSERNILLFELPLMQRKCVATATDVAHDIIFINELPKCYVLTKSKLIEAITFDVINRKFKCKTVLTDLNAKECVPSNSKHLMIVRCDKTLHLIDTQSDKIRTRFQKLPPGVFVDSSSTFSAAGFTPNDKMIVASRYTYLIVWDTETGAPIRCLQSTVSPMVKLFTSDTVNNVVSLLENNSFQVWNLDNLDRDIRHSIEIHQGAVKHIAVSSVSGHVLSHDSETPDAKLISLATGEVVDTLQHSENTGDRIVAVQLSPDGMYAVTRAKMEYPANSSANTTFEALTDDVLWEVETASKVFHAITNRYIVFSPSSKMAAFVTCSFYNRHDWSENIYNVFIVSPETSSNYTINFPYSTEFVSPPIIIQKESDHYFVAVIQECNKRDSHRYTSVRLYVKKLTSQQESDEQTVFRLQNITSDVEECDQFLDVKRAPDGDILIIYAKGVQSYDFETDKGIIPPNNIEKGLVVYDVAKGTALRQMTDFFDSSSDIKTLLVSSQFTHMINTGLHIFNFITGKYLGQLKSCTFAYGSARLALDGRYIIGISENRRKIVVVRTSDKTVLGSVFVHGRAECLEVSEDDRTVVVGCEDGRVMILSLILEFSDPLKELIEKMPSRSGEPDDEDLISNDVRHISMSTPDQHRLSARIRRKSISEERRPPSYTTLHRAVKVSRQSNRYRGVNPCIQQ